MFNDPADLLEKIRMGEDSYLELKAVRFAGEKMTGPRADDLADELAAFGNFVAGVVVLGVDDKTRNVEGIPDERLDAVEIVVRQVVNDAIKPPLPVLIERLRLPDLEGTPHAVLRIDVPRSLFVHRSPGGYWYRLGSSKREMSPDFLARLFAQRSQSQLPRFDEQAVPGALPDALDETLWRRFAPGEDETDATVLDKLHLVVEHDDGGRRVSVAGVLMCTQAPQELIAAARIEAAHYRGVEADTNYQRDARTITGPLDTQIDAAVEWVTSRMAVGAIKDLARKEVPQFSRRAVFEAIVNAVAHRDYSIYGSAIRLFLFDDRLELFSPGALPNTMNVDSLALRQFTRNELVASLLARVQIDPSSGVTRHAYMEKRGEGVPLILRETERLARAPAVYTIIDQSELLLTLPAASPPVEDEPAERIS